MRKFAFLMGFCILLSKFFYAQDQCGSVIDLNWIQANAPDRYQRIMSLENFTNNYISLSQGGTSARLINQNGLIIIPVVVHILYNTNDQNISDAQIQSQIDVLNRDYRRLNPDAVNTPARFTNRATDYGIEFRLACIDPQGNFTNGIIRKYTSKTTFNTNYKRSDGTYDEEAIGIKTATTGSTAWPTDRYLNIWVCSLTSLLGYSTIPADFSVYPQYDGVVIRTTAFGTTGYVAAPYNLGRTSTHEIGHWLNLRHIWGDNYCGNDFVDDTPTQGNFTSGCPIDVRASCNNGPDGICI